MRLPLSAALLGLIALPAAAQDYPRRLPASGGEVIVPSARHQQTYDSWRYAPARRMGDTLYVSGAIVFRGDTEGNDLAAFEGQVRRTFRQLDTVLKAAGASFNDVAMINSFHVWTGPHFTGTPDQQIEVINKVKAEFITGEQPAWTAVGTTGLLSGERGLVEIQIIAHAPQGR